MDMSVGCYLDLPDAGEGFGGETPGRDSQGRQGDALRDCLAANYDRLHRRLLRFLGCPDQASDCLHDAWLRLGDMPIAAAVQNPLAYVYRVACNLALDRLRSNRIWHSAADGDAVFDGAVDPSPGPDAVAEARSELAALERAMLDLPFRHQLILMDLRVGELTRQEVASSHGMSLRRVDTVLRQALDYCALQTGAGARKVGRAPLAVAGTAAHEPMRA